MDDAVQDRSRILVELPVRDAEHLDSEEIQVEIPVLVVGRLARSRVDVAIQLHDQLQLVAIEVRDIETDRLLPAKLPAPEPPVPKKLPQKLLSRSHLLPQLAGAAQSSRLSDHIA
jgi:hypothetical protein